MARGGLKLKNSRSIVNTFEAILYYLCYSAESSGTAFLTSNSLVSTGSNMKSRSRSRMGKGESVDISERLRRSCQKGSANPDFMF